MGHEQQRQAVLLLDQSPMFEGRWPCRGVGCAVRAGREEVDVGVWAVVSRSDRSGEQRTSRGAVLDQSTDHLGHPLRQRQFVVGRLAVARTSTTVGLTGTRIAWSLCHATL